MVAQPTGTVTLLFTDNPDGRAASGNADPVRAAIGLIELSGG